MRGGNKAERREKGNLLIVSIVEIKVSHLMREGRRLGGLSRDCFEHPCQIMLFQLSRILGRGRLRQKEVENQLGSARKFRHDGNFFINLHFLSSRFFLFRIFVITDEHSPRSSAHNN